MSCGKQDIYYCILNREISSSLTGRLLLGVGVGAEYPCGSVAASEQTEEEGIAKNAQNRWFALATSECYPGDVTRFMLSCVYPRHDDRYWIRHFGFCATCLVLDVSAFF